MVVERRRMPRRLTPRGRQGAPAFAPGVRAAAGSHPGDEDVAQDDLSLQKLSLDSPLGGARYGERGCKATRGGRGS